jgi:hypothetical protein
MGKVLNLEATQKAFFIGVVFLGVSKQKYRKIELGQDIDK